MTANQSWLLENADAPIRHNLQKDADLTTPLLQNGEARYWLSRLAERAENRELGAIHGSHDYRMENILGKCAVLGLSREIPAFDRYMAFILDFLTRQIQTPPEETLSFGKIYAFRDYETVLACFLPMLGCADHEAARYIAGKRLDILYRFTKQKRYDIHVDGSKLRGVKKEWQPFVIDFDLYADGNISLPDPHDLVLLAGMYDRFDEAEKAKAETVVSWLFDERYMNLRYGYFYAPGGAYNVKQIIFKTQLVDFDDITLDKSDYMSLLWNCFILSRFQAAKASEWFARAIAYLETFRNEAGRYVFPPHLIAEKQDNYVVKGGHMNVGEDRKAKLYKEIISTYWMNRIAMNLSGGKNDG